MVFRRLIPSLVIIAFLPLATTACFGKFNLVRKVYKLNQDISPDKWVRWIAFLVLSIVPIYGIATFVDALVLNSIEFWTGQNPVVANAGSQKFTHGPNGELAVSTLRSDGAIDIQITTADGTTHFLTLVRDTEGVSALDRDGRFLASVDHGELSFSPAR